jgi:hypothetical protein
MSQQINTENSYPFSWLDEVIEITLNPERTNLKQNKNEVLEQIQSKLPNEIDRIIQCIKTQAFVLYSNEQVKVVAGHYDQSIRVLQRQAFSNQQRYPKTGMLCKTGHTILAALDQLSSNIHNRYSSYLSEVVQTERKKDLDFKQSFKVLCALSVDQLGILLKAADEAKVVLSRSLSMVFKTIVPFLSTDQKKEISWESMRSGSYHPERVDKDAAIAVLEKMIRLIREY